MLILADTGILVRLLERPDPQHMEVRDAVRVLRRRGHIGVIAHQNAAEFWNVCTRPMTSHGGLGLAIPEADRRLNIIERLFHVFSDSIAAYLLWRRLLIAGAGVAVHDARLVAFMMTHGVGHILTLNSADFVRYPSIAVMTPASVLASPP